MFDEHLTRSTAMFIVISNFTFKQKNFLLFFVCLFAKFKLYLKSP